ncbi:hypothetical protein M408DRAFT_122824 [Serendipita vermifera MAFF 305830]|uniref:Uncharacterized protein n=1 Tax=Serendipita vermifera MAFF 305830 TaxID=933852 RepID=A0A0C2XJY0_SERVB|nr:hypothetical protein M408DRAFT_122824 [Serendipita vermifera MAFF 305830]
MPPKGRHDPNPVEGGEEYAWWICLERHVLILRSWCSVCTWCWWHQSLLGVLTYSAVHFSTGFHLGRLVIQDRGRDWAWQSHPNCRCFGGEIGIFG